jgi:hypothetical protein
MAQQTKAINNVISGINFSQCCCWRIKASEMLRSDELQRVTNVSNDCGAFVLGSSSPDSKHSTQTA